MTPKVYGRVYATFADQLGVLDELELDVYPGEPAIEGGHDYFANGFLSGSFDDARAALAKAGAALTAAGLIYRFELYDDDSDRAPDILSHPDIDRFEQQRDALRAKGPRVTGTVGPTSRAKLAEALGHLRGAFVGGPPNVTLSGSNLQLAFEPIAGDRFSVAGAMRVARSDARDWLRAIRSVLEHAAIGHDLALDDDGGMPAQGNAPPKLALGDRLRTGSQDVVHTGTYGDAPVLVTLTAKHAESLDTLRARLALPFDGIAPLLDVRASDLPLPDMLVERLPAGAPATPALGEPMLRELGADIAAILARVHAAGAVVLGIRPELIYVDAGKLSALVPRGPAFIASAPMARGTRSYAVPYLAPEQLSNRSSAASDVFSLCATLFYLGSGSHPFGDPEQIASMAGRIVAGVVAPWPGPPAVGQILARGLATDPAQRPSAAELGAMLRG